MSDIFREIDEELRRDNLGKLWSRYGAYIIAVAVLVVAATAGIVAWRGYQARVQRAESVRFAAALDLARKNQIAQAADAFTQLAQEAGGGQAVLARLQAAALRAKGGDAAAAIADYKGVARDGSVDAVYRDLATLLAALYELPTADPKAVVADMAPLTAEDNPWRFSAREITALADLKAGDRAKAHEIYQKLADDLAAPQGLRARAAEMTAALGG